MNHCVLIGNLCADPEARTTNGGKSQSNFRIAVQRRFANAQGVREADFFSVVCWDRTADFVNSYLVKGRKVAVEGSIQTRSYDAQDGTRRYVTEIIAQGVEAVGGREEAAQSATQAPVAQPEPTTNEQQRMDVPRGGDFVEVDDDDDLPF